MTAARAGRHTSGGRRAYQIVGLAVLAVIGFGVGLGVGVLFEEPTLVVDYALGETRSVEWGAGPVEDSTAPAEVAAPPPPLGARQSVAPETPKPKPALKSHVGSTPAPKPTVRPVAPVAPKPRPAVVAAAPPPSRAPAPAATIPSSGFAVQVGAFAESGTAERLADELRTRGHPVYVKASGSGRDRRWRVRVGPISTRVSADRTASRLRDDEKLPTWVLREDAG